MTNTTADFSPWNVVEGYKYIMTLRGIHLNLKYIFPRFRSICRGRKERPLSLGRKKKILLLYDDDDDDDLFAKKKVLAYILLLKNRPKKRGSCCRKESFFFYV